MSAASREEIAEFLYREAHLLDERRFVEWLDIFTDDVEYLMPLREYLQGDVPPAGHPIIKDDKTMLKGRVMKDATGVSHVETPASMTCRLISNVFFDELPTGELLVFSNFVVRQARKLRDEAWWVGRRKDLFRKVGGSWKIARREVVLDATLLPRGISIFF
jgi:3-phenylpropionate/cinnamic acid dioxygenase small subunit